MYKTISTFDEVNLVNNTLVLCDIDETLIRYKDINHNWWDERKKFWANQMINAKLIDIDNKALSDWRFYIKFNNPTHTDYDGFNRLSKLIKKLDSELVLVTARDLILEDHTKKSLINLDINYNNLYFTSSTPKGEFINDTICLDGYNKVIFIDDNLHNIESVYSKFGNRIEYYRFIM